MKVNVEEVDRNRRKITVEIPSDTVDEKLDEIYEKLRKSAQIPGFRKGKVPRSIIERNFGKQVVEDVRSKLLEDTFKEAMAEQDLVIVSEPVVEPGELERGKDFTYEVSVEIKPRIEPRDYEGVELERLVPEVGDSQVDEAIGRLRENSSVQETVDDDYMAMDGDYVTIDYEGFIDEKPFEGSVRKGLSFSLGRGSVLPEVDRSLVGAKRGDKLKVSDKFPDDYHDKKLAGREVRFDIAVADVKRKVLPEVDDEFAKDVGEFENLGELREKMREDILAYQERMSDDNLKAQLADKLIEANPFDPPPSMVEKQVQTMVARTKAEMESRGLDLEKAGIGLDKIGDSLREDAAKQVKISFILEAIAKKEGLEVDDEDIEKYFRALSEDSGEPVEKVRAWHEKNKLGGMLEKQLGEEKVLDFLMDKAKIVDKKKEGETPSG